MSWNGSNPQLTNQVKEDIADIQENFDYVLKSDGTTGRVIRFAQLTIADGTGANTIKCTLANRWNAAGIAETDNIEKGTTTGSYSLSANGYTLTIEAAGLEGNVVGAFGFLNQNDIAAVDAADVYATSNDITIVLYDGTANLDFTNACGTSNPAWKIGIVYVTDA